MIALGGRDVWEDVGAAVGLDERRLKAVRTSAVAACRSLHVFSCTQSSISSDARASCESQVLRLVFMAALRSRCGHYIFALWFLSIFFFLFLA